MNKRNIILVGLMGTGKSTVGKLLAEALDMSFIDTDTYVERQCGMSVKDIFAQRGESEFRRMETDAIESLLLEEDQVVATGGGAVLAERNRRAMLDGGLVVALTAELETIVRRVRADQSRPLLQGDVEERVRTIMETRKHAYDFADLTVATDSSSAEELAAQIVSRWQAELERA